MTRGKGSAEKTRKTPDKSNPPTNGATATPNVNTTTKRNEPDSGFSPQLTQEKRHASLPELFEAAKDCEQSTGMSMMDIAGIEKAVANALLNPVVHGKLAASISTAINKKLEKALSKYKKSVEDLEQAVDDIKTENVRLRSVCSDRDMELEIMKNYITALREDLHKLKNSTQMRDSIALDNKIDAQEQYGRRNSIRIHNLDCTTHEGVLNAVIDLGTSIDVEVRNLDVVRCHMIGKPRNNKCQAIVHFVHYWKRAEIIKNRHKLKGNPNKIFITEDLTRRNMSIVKPLLDLRSKGVICSVWTSDGRIFYKKSATNNPVLVRTWADVPDGLV
jgi:hypothetical protein